MKVEFLFGKAKIPLDIDITTGEKILEITNQKVDLLFSEGTLNMPAYPLEQILADKLYTTLAYGAISDTNSRSKDLYDLHFLTHFNKDIDYQKVFMAIETTKKQRNVDLSVQKYSDVLDSLFLSSYQKEQWKRYAFQNAYAKDIPFETVMDSAKEFSTRVEHAAQQD